MKRGIIFISLLFTYGYIYSQCMADVGTFGVSTSGVATRPFILCPNDAITFTSNNDFVLPPAGNPPAVAALRYAIYTCPPTDPVNPEDDPCFAFLAFIETGTVVNDGTLNAAANSPNNTYWFAPFTPDAVSGGFYTLDADGDGCWDLDIGSAVQFTLLSEIEVNLIDLDPCSGTVQLQINGGYPEFFPGNYSIVNTGGGNLSPTSTSHGGIVTISNIGDGQQYSLSITNDGNGCSFNYNGGTMNIVNSDPSFSYTPFCADNPTPGNPATPGGTFSFSPNPGDGAVIDPGSGIINNATPGATYFVQYTTGLPCPATSTPQPVTVLPEPPAPNLGGVTLTACFGEPALIIPNGGAGTFNFYNSPALNTPIFTGSIFDAGSIGSPNSPFTIFVTDVSGACEGPPSSITVTLTLPTAPRLDPDEISICGSQSVTITPSSFNIGSMNNYNYYSNASLTDLLGTGSSFTITPTTNIQIHITETFNGCESLASVFTITLDGTINEPPVSPDQTICQGDTIVPLSAMGNNIRWYDADPTVGNPLPIEVNDTLRPTIDTDTPGTITFWATQDDGAGCESPGNPVSILINGLPDAPVSNGDQTICEGDAIPTLSASVNADETIDWYDAATDGNLLSADSIEFTPILAGTYFAEARDTITNCISDTRTAITVTVNPLPTLSNSNATCAADLNSYSVDVIFSDADGISASEGTVVVNSPGNFTINGIATGNDLTIIATNSVTSCSDQFTITAPDCTCPIINPPTSNGDAAICAGDAIPVLSVTVGAGETVDWYDAASGGNLLLSNSTTFTPTGAGTFFAETRNTSTNCISNSRTSISLTINPIPSLQNSDAACSADLSSYSVNVTINDADGIGVNEGQVTDNGGGSFSIDGITPGTDLIITATNSTTGCSEQFTITSPDCSCPVVSPPVNDGDAIICQGDAIPTLTGTVGAGETIDWYDAAIGGNLLLSGSNSFTPTAAGTFFAETRNTTNNCISDTRTAISLTINPLPILDASNATCAADFLTYAVDITLTNADGILASEGVVSDNGGGNFTITGIDPNNDLTITATNSTTNCSDQFIITSPGCSCPDLSPPLSDGDEMICQGDAFPALTATVGAGETVDWYDAAIGGNLLLSNSTTFTPTGAGTFFAETRRTDNNCVSDTRTAISLTINPLPSLSNSDVNCAPDLLTYSASISLINADGITVNEGTISDLGGGNFTVDGITAGTDLIINATNSTTTCTDQFTITAPDCSCPVLNAPVSPGDIAICEGDVIPSISVTVGVDETVDWYDAATGGNILLAGSTNFTPTSAGTFFAETRNTINNCISDTRTAVSLSINPLPTLDSESATCAP